MRVAVLLLLLGCAREPAVVVLSKNFTEQVVLGEILAQTIEREGAAVTRRLDLGGTFVCDGALRAGQGDVYIEYTGTALTAILKRPAAASPDDALKQVRAEYARADLAVGEPLGFENTFAMLVRGADAKRLGLVRLSELAPHAAQMRAGFGYEFLNRSDGFPGLARAYGLSLRETRVMDLGLTYRALADGQVDLIAGNSTDGVIDRLGFVQLEDDRRYFPPYQAVPVTRRATLGRQPALGRALRALAGRIDARTMRRLNEDVDGRKRPVADVARAFVRATTTSTPAGTRKAP